MQFLHKTVCNFVAANFMYASKVFLVVTWLWWTKTQIYLRYYEITCNKKEIGFCKLKRIRYKNCKAIKKRYT